MRTLLFLLFTGLSFWSCKSSDKQNTAETGVVAPIRSDSAADFQIVLGAERFDQYLAYLKDKKVGMVVNQTSTIGSTHLVDSFQKLGINVVKVFAPEHGFRGDHSAGAVINSGVDEQTGLPVLSLYGKTKKPTPSMLEGVDVMVFDIQDVGVRFYTYISTMHYVMEACAELDKEVLVLDRPNPNGFYIDGPVLEKGYESFIGMHQIPLVHGLTVGELALMINGESWLKNGVKCKLKVVECLNYHHQKLYQLPIAPSPNLPNMNSVYLYPYLGLFEGTNVSIGRGTDQPFQIVGRPGFDGYIKFTPVSIPGVSDNPKYMNTECSGYVVRDALDSALFKVPQLNLDWLILLYKANDEKKDGEFFKNFFFKLSGNNTLKSQIESGLSEDEIRKSWQPELIKFEQMRQNYLLYP